MTQGVQITQGGIPLADAQPYQLSLNSLAKSLDVAYEIDVDFMTPAFGPTNGVVTIEIFRHNLNILAPFEFQESVLSGTGNTDVSFGLPLLSSIYGDTQHIYYTTSWFSGESTAPMRIKGKLRVYNLDLTQSYVGDANGTEVVGASATQDFGAKFIDQSKGLTINDADLGNFTLNTDAKMQMVQAYGIQATVSGQLTIGVNQGYPPTYLICPIIGTGTTATIQALGTEQAANVKFSGNTVIFKGQQTSLFGDYGYIILQDPAEIAA